MSLKDLKIGTRLGLGFAVMLLLMALIAGTGVLRLTNVGSATDEMVGQAVVKERLATEWLSNLRSNTVANFAMVKTTDPEIAAYFAKVQAAGSARISPAQKKLESMLSTPESECARSSWRRWRLGPPDSTTLSASPRRTTPRSCDPSKPGQGGSW